VEPLAAGATSEVKQVAVPIPTSVLPGTYYVGWLVDPFNEVPESDETNGFYLPSTRLTITTSLVFGLHVPYPVIFIHGLNSNDQTWSTFLSQLDDLGWSFGGRMDYCLNYDGNLATGLLAPDFRDFTIQSTLNVGDYYTVNFDVNPDGSVYNNTVQSNMSAVVKQGKAMQSAIKHVLDKTGAQKVVLVGHSMGGLASREYLQNSVNWQSDGNHHVAKLLTIGTPHGGSNQWTFGILDGYSEAVRDLRWSYSNGNAGVYLFGGNENNLSSVGFHNSDVNCNGVVGDNITGLNQRNLPNDLAYSCVVGTGGFAGDGVVDASRADLNAYYVIHADTFQVNQIHTDLPKEIVTNLEGLDEPPYFSQSYRVGIDTLYFGTITTQSATSVFTDDYDDFSFNLSVRSQVNIKVGNISVPQLSATIFDNLYALKASKASNALAQIDTSLVLSPGKYYLEIQARSTSYSWMFPYTFRLHATPVTEVEDLLAQIPSTYQLFQNFPNPFNPSTTISFQVPVRGFVSLSVFDVLGREVATLVSQEMELGRHSVVWDASAFTSGTYFYRLQSGNHVETKKLILLR